ncbi:MAG: HU family DNA-binding protein [Candidatus Ornithomonoglobus sp.]
MKEKLIKHDVVKRIVDLSKSKNHPYTQEEVNNILTSFFDVIENAISNGDSVNLNGYMTIEPQYRAERKARNVKANTIITVPEQYRVHIKSGIKFNRAAKHYTELKLGGRNE